MRVVVNNEKGRVTGPRRRLELLSAILQCITDAILYQPPPRLLAGVVCQIRIIFGVRLDLLHLAKHLNVAEPDSEIGSTLHPSLNWFASNPARQTQLLEQFLRDRVFGQFEILHPQAWHIPEGPELAETLLGWRSPNGSVLRKPTGYPEFEFALRGNPSPGVPRFWNEPQFDGGVGRSSAARVFGQFKKARVQK